MIYHKLYVKMYVFMESFKEPFHRHLAFEYIAFHLIYKYYDYTFSIRTKYLHVLRCR